VTHDGDEDGTAEDRRFGNQDAGADVHRGS
jgi:hypothetical protein